MSKTDFTKPTDEADKQEALDLWQQQIAYAETIYNGTVIRWRYWVEQMPQLSAAEAARLMSALDPDLFANLDNRPNKNDPSKRCERAAVIQRLAERKGMQVATPAEWLAWAIQEGFVVHDGFRLAVESAPAKQVNAMKKAALIAELEYEWSSIEADISDATRNGLKAAAHTGKHGEWDRGKARAWAVSRGKIKRDAPVHGIAAAWSGLVTRNTIGDR